MGTSSEDYKRVRHFNERGHLHELTFSCFHQLELLSIDHWCSLLAESVDRAVKHHFYRLTAYVFMPDHVHLLVYPLREASPIDKLLFAIKRPFSYRIKKLLEDDRNPLLDELMVRQRPGVTTFRFWQEGPGYDRNISNPKTAFAAIDYFHMNPVRRGLCARAIDWKWSSARFYAGSIDALSSPTISRLPAEWLFEGGVQVT